MGERIPVGADHAASACRSTLGHRRPQGDGERPHSALTQGPCHRRCLCLLFFRRPRPRQAVSYRAASRRLDRLVGSGYSGRNVVGRCARDRAASRKVRGRRVERKLHQIALGQNGSHGSARTRVHRAGPIGRRRPAARVSPCADTRRGRTSLLRNGHSPGQCAGWSAETRIGHAFERLGCLRVEFKTDSLNEPSRTALLGIGATFEGIFRNHMVMPGGRMRHSAYYSVIDDEWPAVRDGLERSLAR